MNVSDLVKFNREKFYNGAVQTDWFYDETKLADISGSYVFHGPKYYGVSDSDVQAGEHKLLDTASYVERITNKVSEKKPKNSFVLTIAKYGTGKSHLAVTLGALLSGDSRLQKPILENIGSIDNAISNNIKKNTKKINLVIALNGMKNFNLDYEILRCVKLSLKKNKISEDVLQSITKTYDVAKYFIKSNFDSNTKDFVDAAKTSKIDVDKTKLKNYLIDNIESDSKAIDAVNMVFKKITGDSLHWEQGISAGDIILKVSQELCGDEKPFNKVVIIFDEFGRYIEYVAANPAIAGDASLQQIFEAIQSSNGSAIFLGFIQYELEAYLSHIDKTSNVIRYVGRYSSSEKYYLSSNFETILANLLKKNNSEEFDNVIGKNLEIYKNYHDRIHSSLLSWSGDKAHKNVWTSNSQYRKVILEGCYPLHPLTVWILSNSEGWMQQRSTISFCSDMYDSISDDEIDSDWLPYVYPIDIIDSGIFSEMLNSEEEGRVQSQNCMLYHEIITKIGDKLSSDEEKVLKSILVARIAGFRFSIKEDAYTAFKYCSNLKDEQVKKAVKNLEDRHGVISYDDQAHTYDLIAEANGFNEFKRIYSRYKTGNLINIEEIDENIIEYLGISTPIDTSFAQEHHITSSEWKFEKVLLNSSSIDDNYINSLIRALDSVCDGESYRGTILYAYCSSNSNDEIERLCNICQNFNLDKMPIIILFLDDPDAELISSMTIKETLNRFSLSDSEKFSKHISAQHKAQDKKISQKFTELVMERKQITNDGLTTYSGRLNTLCTERFRDIYNSPVPFVFDGFENKKSSQAKKTLFNICVKIFDRSLMNIQSYQALNTADKNRIKSCMSTGVNNSWQIFDSNCQLVLPHNELLLKIYKEADSLIPDDETITVSKLFGKYLHAPYGMNVYSYVLFVIYFIGKHEQLLLSYIGNDRLTADSLNNIVFKNQKIKLSDIQRITLRKNQYADIDVVADVCREIIENTNIYSCGLLRKKLNDTIQVEGEGSNQLIIGQARLRLDDGDRIKASLEEKIDKVKQFISDAKNKLVPHKFIGVLSYVDISSGLIESNLPFVYPDDYIEFMSDAKSKIEVLLEDTFEEAVNALTCNDITKISSFQNTYNKVVKILNEHEYVKQAELVEERVNIIVEESKARNQYNQALGECEKDIALSNNIENVSFEECNRIEKKMSGWISFLDEASLPDSISDSLREKIEKIISNTSSRREEILQNIKAIENNYKKISTYNDIEDIKIAIIDILDEGIPQKNSKKLKEILDEINDIENTIDGFPQSLDELSSIIKNKNDRKIIINEAKILYNDLLDKQEGWVDEVVVPVEKGKVNSAQECGTWLQKLSCIPSYVDKKTVDRVKKAEGLVNDRLHACKVEGVLSLYVGLTKEEREEFLRLIKTVK